jgi:hypothetical protein
MLASTTTAAGQEQMAMPRATPLGVERQMTTLRAIAAER